MRLPNYRAPQTGRPLLTPSAETASDQPGCDGSTAPATRPCPVHTAPRATPCLRLPACVRPCERCTAHTQWRRSPMHQRRLVIASQIRHREALIAVQAQVLIATKERAVAISSAVLSAIVLSVIRMTLFNSCRKRHHNTPCSRWKWSEEVR